ncbi:hypothetical protein EVAR_17965_1 [Eumeta japonica]|uniref:Uncharacterized protein n=1 Tax=Eumeta variegata TaxID=151549 RepID=A0A4C1V0A7_EUMVA|nr:hypothetical protein EVAR_17965_1 [Eumeta japonica]
MGRRGVARTPHVCALFICTTRRPKVCTAARQRGFLEQRHHTFPLAARPLKQKRCAPTSMAGFPRLLRQYRNCPGKHGKGNGSPRPATVTIHNLLRSRTSVCADHAHDGFVDGDEFRSTSDVGLDARPVELAAAPLSAIALALHLTARGSRI